MTHSDLHQRICVYLYNVFCGLLATMPSAVVLHDVRVAWDVPDLKPHGPDIAVIFGIRQPKNWSTFDVAEEGARPALIIEVTSPKPGASTSRPSSKNTIWQACHYISSST